MYGSNYEAYNACCTLIFPIFINLGEMCLKICDTCYILLIVLLTQCMCFCINCKQHPDHLALSILNGHNAMVAGSYKHAIGMSYLINL